MTNVDYIAQSILADPGPLASFLQDNHGSYESHRDQLETLQAQLEDGRSELTASWGTEDIKWLGDYLVHKSPATEGSLITLWVPAARIVSEARSDVPDFDLAASAENELLRVMNQSWPEQIVFLPLDDPLFAAGRVPINSSGEISLGAPKRHYDAIALLPLACREIFGE